MLPPQQIDLMNGFIGTHIRRCNRNRMLLGIACLCLSILIFSLETKGFSSEIYSKEWWEQSKLTLTCTALFGFGIYNAWTAWLRAENIWSAPAITQLSHFNIEPVEVVKEIQREIGLHGNLLSIPGITITPNWLILTGTWDIEILNLNELLWVFSSSQWDWIVIFPWKKKHLRLLDKQGRFLEVQKGYAAKKLLVIKLIELAPWVRFGNEREFNDELAKGFEVLRSDALKRRNPGNIGVKAEQDVRAIEKTVGKVDRAIWWPAALAGIMCMAGMLPLSYGYFQALRWVVGIVCLLGSGHFFRKGKNVFAWSFVAISVLFNPIVPFHFRKETWQIIDLICGGILLAYSFVANRLDLIKEG